MEPKSREELMRRQALENQQAELERASEIRRLCAEAGQASAAPVLIRLGASVERARKHIANVLANSPIVRAAEKIAAEHAARTASR